MWMLEQLFLGYIQGVSTEIDVGTHPRIGTYLGTGISSKRVIDAGLVQG